MHGLGEMEPHGREPWGWTPEFDYRTMRMFEDGEYFVFSSRFANIEQDIMDKWLHHWKIRNVRTQVFNKAIWVHVEDHLRAFNIPLMERMLRLLP